MVHAKNYETVSTFVKVMQKKPWPLFFLDTVYVIHLRMSYIAALSSGLLSLNKNLSNAQKTGRQLCISL